MLCLVITVLIYSAQYELPIAITHAYMPMCGWLWLQNVVWIDDEGGGGGVNGRGTPPHGLARWI